MNKKTDVYTGGKSIGSVQTKTVRVDTQPVDVFADRGPPLADNEWVYESREVLGLTQLQLADMLGYVGERRRGQVDDLETGRRPLREPQRRLIEAYLEGYRPKDWPL